MAMMASSELPEPPPVSRYGLTQVYAPQGGGLVDIVFVHGLNGNPHNTWTAENSKIFWPAQLLPPILAEERARILVYGYDADVTSFTDGASRDKIHNHAEHLVAELAANRRLRKCMERPIIFVAHSLGGLVVKRALIYSSEIRGNYTEHLRSVFVSTYGILFLGTPHKGSDIAEWGSRLEWICGAVMPKKFVDTQPQLVDALKKDNETLQNIDRQFIQLTSRFHIYFFHESKPTNLKGTLRFIVDEESASPNIQDVERAGIQADHSHMCKFESDSAPGFDLVAEGIQRYAGEAPATIVSRWTSEMAERDAKKRAEIQERFPGSTLNTPHTDSSSTTNPSPDTSQILPSKVSPHLPRPGAPEVKDEVTSTSPTKSTESYFIVPPGFRKNTFFVGMDKEYKELDLRLFDKRRRDGTATVLLHGQPGGGKTHLARHYVFKEKERKKFSGGIFWITAKSREECHHAFSNIKQKVVSRDAPTKCDGVNGNEYVSIVKNWFEGRQEWLIVFDGVSVDNDDDTAELARFIPDSKNSSIIYISRAKNLESKQRLLRPFPIKVGPLKEAEAKKLLFKELHIKSPNEAQELKATELVKQVGCLPLAIDAICHRLADTHEPLVKYKLQYSSDPTLEKTYNQILDDLLILGHDEASNLINVLCWFASDMPVEMVHLGIKSLRADIEVKAAEQPGGKRDINTTFGILMRYALIERNEPDDKDSMSSSRDSLIGPEPIDMLKIHSVIQNFCCASLNKRDLLPIWLGYAVKLFCWSYHEADIKIKMKGERKGEMGRVSDYRYYKVHGQRLWDHAISDESKTQSLQTIRNDLTPVLQAIDEEIQQREPSSSQEDLKDGIFQISIFDRTSSSSESAPSLPGPPTPNYRPTPLPLKDQNEFGFPIEKPMDSPGSFGTASPVDHRYPRVVGLSPRQLDFEDIGYDSDREGYPNSHPMRQPNISETTARVQSPRPRAPTIESLGEGWQVVPSGKKLRKPRRDLGSFRPTPARVRVDRSSVPRSDENKKPHRRESSPALNALKKVQSQSPSPPRSGLASIFRRENRTPTAGATQPTWAGITAGTARKDVMPALVTAERGRSRESPQSKQGSAQPSPLAAEFVPHPALPITGGSEFLHTSPAYSRHLDDQSPSGYRTLHPGSNSSLAQIPQGQSLDYYPDHRSPFSRPNPSPLAYEDNVPITSKRPLPVDLHSTQNLNTYPTPPPNFYPLPASGQPSPENRTSPYQPMYDASYRVGYPTPSIPAGYTSQPMSRHHSGRSHDSVAETEPIHYPSAYSPQLMPSSYPDNSPRERYPDGQAFRKSPKTGFAVPAYHETSSNRVSPHDLSQMGGWTLQSQAPGSYGTSMSRSSSGPGFAVERTPGSTPTIIGFDNHPGSTQYSTHPGSVQFGEHPPVSFEEARRRTVEHELRLRERHREMEAIKEINEQRYQENKVREWEEAKARGEDGPKRESAPYPDINLIPTHSDGGTLQGMVDGRPGAGPRGHSVPMVDQGVGLGLHIG